jgi:transposase
VGQAASHPAGRTAQCRPYRLVTGGRGQCIGSGAFWGAKTGPNPTDRRKSGSKHHTITDANGIPLGVLLTGANRHDITQLLPLIDTIPEVAGKVGHPRYRPQSVQGDRGYDSEAHREALRGLGIEPLLARRRTEHGSGLGRTRWVVERTLSWLHQFRRLRIRCERRADIHEAFMAIGCYIICWRFLERTFC